MPSIRVIMGVVRWVVFSVVVHALVLWLLAPSDEQLVAWHPPALPHLDAPQATTIVELISPESAPAPSSSGGKTGVVARRGAPKRSADAWERVAIHTEGGGGAGRGNGDGEGTGNGI